VLWTLRQLVAIVVLPFTVAVVIPIWLARRDGIRLGLASSWGDRVVQACGTGLLAIGVVLFVASLGRFAREGKGTLAPWDPPRRLVVRGPYRYVRNPMISGVAIALKKEAAVLLSSPHLLWSLAFLGLNAVYIPLLEEPLLAERFGADYSEYRRHVPRLLPRWRPWKQ